MSDLLREMPIDAQLGDLRAALAPQRVLQACKSALTRATPGERESWKCARIIEALYSPGREVRIAYSLLTDPQTPDERIWPEAQIVYLVSPVRPSESQRGELLEIDGHTFEAYHFPNDRRLRTVRRFQGKADAIAAWQSWINQGAGDFRIDGDSLQRRLVRYVPEQKWIIRLRADGADPRAGTTSKRRIAVLAAQARQCELVAARHRALAKWARENNAPFTIPDVVGQSLDIDLIALEWLRGDALLDALHSDSKGILKRIAHAMHVFHRIPASTLPDCEVANPTADFRAATSDLALAMPDSARQLMDLDSAFAAKFEQLHFSEAALLHNDFHWNQVTIKPNRLVLLDLDCVAIGDALIDVANFATQIELLGQRGELEVNAVQSHRWSAEFLEAWAAESGQTPDFGRMGAYSALSALRLARGMMRHLRPGWQELAVTCIAKAESALCLREVQV